MIGIRKKISTNLEKYNKVVIWGAGGLANTAINNWIPDDKIDYIVDKNAKKGDVLKSHKIYSINKLLKDPPELIVVCSSAYIEIFQNIKDMNIKCNFKYIYELFIENYKFENELSKLYIDIIATKNCNFVKLLLTKPQILVNISFRITKFIKNYKIFYPIYILFYIIHHIFCMLTSIQLPLHVEAGPGLIFAHPGTIVFTGKAKLGSFVTIYHCCTIGTTLKGGSPIIDNFVTIYTGSHILGATHIAKHSKVGALSLLLDFKGKEYSTIAGIPASTKRQFL